MADQKPNHFASGDDNLSSSKGFKILFCFEDRNMDFV